MQPVGRPPDVLRQVLEPLAPGGAVVRVQGQAAERLQVELGPVEDHEAPRPRLLGHVLGPLGKVARLAARRADLETDCIFFFFYTLC